MFRSTRQLRRWQRGISLPSVVFLLVVLGGLALYMAGISQTQHESVALGIQTQRARLAADAGVEWAKFQEGAAVDGSCDGQGTLSGLGGVLSGFTVTITCSVSQHTEAGTTFDVYQYASVAAFGSYGQPNHVAYQVEATYRVGN